MSTAAMVRARAPTAVVVAVLAAVLSPAVAAGVASGVTVIDANLLIGIDTTWTAHVRYLLAPGVTVYVENQATLTIPRGTVVELGAGAVLDVRGALQTGVGGDPSAVTLFTGDPLAPWGCVIFASIASRYNANTREGSILQHTTFENGGVCKISPARGITTPSNAQYGNMLGQLHVEGPAPLIRGVSVKDSAGHGISFGGTTEPFWFERVTVAGSKGVGIFSQGTWRIPSINSGQSTRTYTCFVLWQKEERPPPMPLFVMGVLWCCYRCTRKRPLLVVRSAGAGVIFNSFIVIR